MKRPLFCRIFHRREPERLGKFIYRCRSCGNVWSVDRGYTDADLKSVREKTSRQHIQPGEFVEVTQAELRALIENGIADRKES